MNTAEIMAKGMECLRQNLGIIETEYFISAIIKEQFDYTKWQREYFDTIPSDRLHEEAVAYGKAHPYHGKAKEIIKVHQT